MTEGAKEMVRKLVEKLELFFYFFLAEDIIRNRQEIKALIAEAEREELEVTKERLAEALVDKYWIPEETYTGVIKVNRKGEWVQNVVVRDLGTVKMEYWLKNCTREIALTVADSFVTRVLKERYTVEQLMEAAIMFSDCGRTNLEVTCEYNNYGTGRPKRIRLYQITFEDIRTPETLVQVIDAFFEVAVDNLKEYKGCWDAREQLRTRLKELNIRSIANMDCTGFRKVSNE